MFENQMKRKIVPMNGNHFAAIGSSMFPRVMLSRMSTNARLDGGLQAVRARLHPAGDVDHREARQRRRDDDVEDRLVELDRADREPRVELELVLRPVGLVDRGERGGRTGEDRGERQQGGEHAAGHEGCLEVVSVSNGRMIMDTVK